MVEATHVLLDAINTKDEEQMIRAMPALESLYSLVVFHCTIDKTNAPLFFVSEQEGARRLEEGKTVIKMIIEKLDALIEAVKYPSIYLPHGAIGVLQVLCRNRADNVVPRLLTAYKEGRIERKELDTILKEVSLDRGVVRKPAATERTAGIAHALILRRTLAASLRTS